MHFVCLFLHVVLQFFKEVTCFSQVPAARLHIRWQHTFGSFLRGGALAIPNIYAPYQYYDDSLLSRCHDDDMCVICEGQLCILLEQKSKLVSVIPSLFRRVIQVENEVDASIRKINVSYFINHTEQEDMQFKKEKKSVLLPRWTRWLVHFAGKFGGEMLIFRGVVQALFGPGPIWCG